MSVDMANFIKPKMVRIIHQKPQKSMTIKMVHLPKGRFMMGEGSEQREVIIDYEFEMGKYPVTFDEYDMYCEDENKEKPSDRGWGRGKRPVINVSWHDAVAYCKWLSEKSNQNYRLPSEIEWEYACRAGTTTKWSFGDDEKELKKYAWYNDNSNGSTHEVGLKESNDWKLHDMHGNVFEWCEDWYDKDEDRKVLRGGSWNLNSFITRSSSRNRLIPTLRGSLVGFRLLRTLPEILARFNLWGFYFFPFEKSLAETR
jgi:formylglycine-generating enzyme required for sulfatase activity